MKTKIIWTLVMVALFGAMMTTASATDYNVYNGNSVQTAITGATAGDTIYVHNYSGTYAKFDVNKQLYMIGVDMPTVDAGGSGSPIRISAASCTVKGFRTIHGSSNLWGDGGIAVHLSGSTIDGNLIESNNGNGIWFDHTSGNLINNTIRNNAGPGVRYPKGCTVTGNTFSGNSGTYGALAFESGNIVYHNNFYEGSLYDTGSTWYSAALQEGNYWWDNTGCVDNNCDGICDSHYKVPDQTGNRWDEYPLVNTWPPTGGDTTPPTSITNLANSTGNFWINWTWTNPATDFNHTMIYIDNGWVLNTSGSFYNDSYSAHATKTISTHTVDANGNVNSTWVNQTTTIPNNQITITNTSGASVNEGETVYVDYDATDADSDTPVFSCNRTDLFTDFNTGTGKGNWTTTDTDVGVHYVDFGVSDGYGSTDNYTMTITVNNAEQTPPDPTNIANTTGNFWVNHTWAAGTGNVTDSYNVSVNDVWHNATISTHWNAPYSAHAWQNITVYAWNTSGTGTLSAGSVSQNTQIPNNLPVLDPIGNKAVNETETLAIDADTTDSDSDTLTYSCNRTSLFTDFDPATGAGNWTPGYDDAGIYYVDFGTADGYGGIDNETVRITVNESEVTGNLLYFSPDTSTVPGYCSSVDVDVMARVNESNPIIATDVNITFDPGCINITNWVNNSGVWNGSTCPLWSVPQGYVHITTTVGGNPAVNGTVKIGTLTIHCNKTTCCGTPLNFTSQSMFIKEGSGFIYPERDNGSFLCGWYWKDYNGEVEGGYMPDFDQNQDFNATQPGIEENYCAPTVMANSLWWFDQKYPDRDVVSPGATPQELVQELAELMDTNGQRTGIPHNGTYVADEQAGTEDYLIQHGLTDLLYEHTELKPEFDWIEEEIKRCQDVKLDLGFYQVLSVNPVGPDQWAIEWMRIGGHAVTAAGVNSNCSQIAVSDPDADNAEFGLPGVVRGPNHNHGGVPFRDPAYDHTQHNDGVSASHDIYNVSPSISPGGTWELTDQYWKNTTVAYRYAYNNGGQWMNTTNYNGTNPPLVGEIRTEIEAAVVVSPKNCTPAIEVNKTVWDPVTEKWVEEITSHANLSGCMRYRIQVQNNGTCCDFTNLVVNDTLPAFLTYDDSAIPFEPTDLGGNKYQWTFPTLNKSETRTIEFNATVNNTGNGTNEASATAWCAEFGVECSDGDGAYITAVGCGDVNGDGFANIQDGMMVAAGNTGVSEWAADADCDGFANIQDGMKIAAGDTDGCCTDCS